METPNEKPQAKPTDISQAAYSFAKIFDRLPDGQYVLMVEKSRTDGLDSSVIIYGANKQRHIVFSQNGKVED